MPSSRALFVIPSLRCGGAERVFTLVLNGLAARGFDMHLALCQNEGSWLSRLSSAVTVHDLKSPRVRLAGWPLIKLVRSLRPGTVLATSSHLNTVVGLAKPFLSRQTQVALREVNINHLEPALLKGLRGTLIRRAYQSADRVISLGAGMRELVVARLGVDPQRVVPIYNPIEPSANDASSSMASRSGAGKRLMAIGTLEHRKGFDRIIAAMPRLLMAWPGSTLTIFGEGPERAALERQAESLSLSGSVRLAGFSATAANELRSADLFILSSRFEGMPNVLLEAIAARRPFVAVEHPGGTREVIELLGEERRITSDLSEWRPEWFEPLAPQSCDLAERHFSYAAIVEQYADVVFPEAAGARLAA